jgi:hypothetical protein
MKRIVVLSWLAVSLVAHAEWTPLIQVPEFGENHYIDLQSISDVDGTKQVTTMSDFPKDKKEACQGDTCAFLTSSRISVRQIECEVNRQRQVKFTDFDGQMGNGNITQTATGGPKKRYFRWYTPQPGSFFEVLIKKVCTP